MASISASDFTTPAFLAHAKILSALSSPVPEPPAVPSPEPAPAAPEPDDPPLPPLSLPVDVEEAPPPDLGISNVPPA